MALPPQAVERLTHDPVRTPGWSGRLLMFATTLFLLSIFAYFSLVFGYDPYLQKQFSDLQNQTKLLSQQVQSDNQTKIIAFYSQLANLRTILDKHAYSSNIFGLIEKSVSPNTYFTKFTYNFSNQQVSLSGVAKSAQDVPAQIQIFQNTHGIAQVTFNNLTAQPGGQWQFDVILTLDPSVVLSLPNGTSAATPTATSSPNTSGPTATSTSPSTPSQATSTR